MAEKRPTGQTMWSTVNVPSFIDDKTWFGYKLKQGSDGTYWVWRWQNHHGYNGSSFISKEPVFHYCPKNSTTSCRFSDGYSIYSGNNYNLYLIDRGDKVTAASSVPHLQNSL